LSKKTQNESLNVRCPGPTWQDVLDEDEKQIPYFLRSEAPYRGGLEDIATSRYLTREWHELEKKQLWSRVWQYVCREEQLSNVGSYVVYDIADQSYIVVRTEDNSIKAYPNACLHRGRILKTHDGRATEFRCSFHGWSWQLDGKLKLIPAEWDFPHAEERNLDLPGMKVETWEGFVFLNPDPSAQPLGDFLGPEIQKHFARWDFENRYLSAHVAKIIRCNWKVAIEAFSEGYHVGATHPQGATYTGDPQSQIDVWGNVARELSPKGIPSPLLDEPPTQEQMLRDALDVREGEALPLDFKEGDTLRKILSAKGRERFRPSFGDRVDEIGDAEFLDAWNYSVFPNFHPWGAFNRIVFRFRPNGDDHESCIFEIMYLAPFQGERPESATIIHLGPDDPWSNAPVLEKLAMVVEQDTFNMERVHQGMKVLRRDSVMVSAYQESLVRWRHELLTVYIEERNAEGNER